MIELCARYAPDNETFSQWKQVHDIIQREIRLHSNLRAHWEIGQMPGQGGFEGLNHPDVLNHFGMTRVYRGPTTHVRFVFTEEQYTMFLLRWV